MSDWEPETADLRDQDTKDELTHAERNAIALRVAEQVLNDEEADDE